MTDVFSVLAADHARVSALSDQLTGPSAVPADQPRRRKAVANELVMELSRHEVIEEILLWPVVRERLDDGQKMCETALEQEHDGKRALQELLHVEAGNYKFDNLANTVASILRQHIGYEENIVWPKLRLALSEEEAGRLGAEMELAKRTAPTRPHPHVPPDPRLLKTIGPAAAVLDKARNTLRRS